MLLWIDLRNRTTESADCLKHEPLTRVQDNETHKSAQSLITCELSAITKKSVFPPIWLAFRQRPKGFQGAKPIATGNLAEMVRKVHYSAKGSSYE